MNPSNQENFIEDNDIIIDDNGTEVKCEPPYQITKPLDPSTIWVESQQVVIDTLLKRIVDGKLELTRGIHRTAGLWTNEAKSQLIESLIVRIPLPAFYIDATNEKKWLVLDGLQRLTALKRFMIDKNIKLKGLEYLTQLEGQSYTDMRRSLLRRIEETRVTVYLVDEGTPPDVKFNIFKRINTGGLPLSPQEIRHVLYQGKASTLLEKLSRSKEFKQATANGVRSERMTDREFVLRFIAFLLTPRSYLAKGLDHFLNETMVIVNQKTEDELNDIANRFKRAMWAAHQIFENDAFRERHHKGERINKINKALFEVFSVNFALRDKEELELLIQKRELLKTAFMKLMNDPAFESAVSGGTSNLYKVELRFSKIETLFKELLA
jgi:uncharacterized protein with ParB-like and HNH nuclease domain